MLPSFPTRTSAPRLTSHVFTFAALVLGLSAAPLRAQTPAPPDVPLLIREALPGGIEGVQRTNEPATFGIPFEQGQVGLANGRPALRVAGSSHYQFRTLRSWPDGSVMWALVDLQSSVQAGGERDGLRILSGTGQSPQTQLGQTTGTQLKLDTGALRVNFPLTTGLKLADIEVPRATGAPLRGSFHLVARGIEGHSLVSTSDTQVNLEENGPARAVVVVTGSLAQPTGEVVTDYTLRLTFWANSSEVDTVITVRNANIDRPAHMQLSSLELDARLQDLENPVLSLAHHAGHAALPLAPGGWVSLFQGHTSAQTFHTDSKDYYPHLPKQPDSEHDFVIEGYSVQGPGFKDFHSNNANVYPEHGWLGLNSPQGGVTVAMQYMPYFWPASLAGAADGTVRVGFFPAQNPAPFTFIWRQHESRKARFRFHTDHAPSAQQKLAMARRLDAPFVGRAKFYEHYDSTKVFAYDLLSIDRHNLAYEVLGFDHKVTVKNQSMAVQRYLGKSTTGSSNNYAQTEDRLAAGWLRHGFGGQYVKALDVALWKSEWQFPRSDNFHDINDPGPLNPDLQHTDRTFGDEEHRYLDGIILAYHLTGDERYRWALVDETEVLQDISFFPQERAMYQTLRAQALLAEFSASVPLRDAMLERLVNFATPTLDIEVETGGYGWQDLPDHGDRRYFVFSGDLNSEKPPGEHFQMRGFMSSSLGPLALYHVARILGPSHPQYGLARGRLRDLAWWTRVELFPFKADPAERRLPYSYAVSLQQVVTEENFDFHPILIGQAEAWRDTGDLAFLAKGYQQLEAFAAHDEGSFDSNLPLLDTRLDCQHFMAAVLDALNL
ncbi:MAG: hypothetical protein DHS20C15_25380 [Planctomycetota bacterium]|nr:MAG: hypothetical protein DHS20C15_25380 [Planctomycetota bacterium]